MVKAGSPAPTSHLPSLERSISRRTSQDNKEKLDTKIQERLEATNEVYETQISLPNTRFYKVFLCGKGTREQLSEIRHS